MKAKQQEIERLFAMFHDFDIVKADLTGETLSLSITIPWGSMWKKDDYSYTIRLEIFGCTYFNCIYYPSIPREFLKSVHNLCQGEPEQLTTTNPKDLEHLQLSIQSSEQVAPSTFELACNSEASIDFASITLNASDYRVYNQDEEEITLETMEQWASDWWDSIQKMWDEQKKE